MQDTEDNLPQSTTQAAQRFDDEDTEGTTRANQSYKAFDEGTAVSSVTLTDSTFSKYKESIFKARPNIGNVYKEYGEIPFYTYSKSHIRNNRNPVIRERKTEFISLMYDEVQKLLGSEIAESVAKQLKDNNSISTIQHSATLGHPYVISSTLQNALPYFGSNNPALKNVLVLACANVSFNNYKFPRGHLLHTVKNGVPTTHPVTLFGHTSDARPVALHPPYDHHAIIEIKNRLTQLWRNQDLTKEQLDSLVHFFEGIYSSPHALSQRTYHDQLTVTNYFLFKKFFQNYKKFTPNLIFLSQEAITLSLFMKYHLQGDTMLHRLLFDERYLELISRHFDGLNGAFSQKDNYGTFLFWGLPKDTKYRVQLWREGQKLKAKDGSYEVRLTPEGIHDAIEKNELIPNTMLTFITLAFYYGMYLGGGPAQTLNLTKMKEAYIAMQHDYGDTESAEAIMDLPTKNLVVSRPSLAYLDIPATDMRIPATGLDWILYGNGGSQWARILEATKQVTLAEIINRALPSFYAEFVPHAEKQTDFSMITERDVEKFTGLSEKIPCLAQIS